MAEALDRAVLITGVVEVMEIKVLGGGPLVGELIRVRYYLSTRLLAYGCATFDHFRV